MKDWRLKGKHTTLWHRTLGRGGGQMEMGAIGAFGTV